MIRSSRKIFGLAIAAVMVWSCTTSRKIKYLENLDVSGSEQYFTFTMPDYRIQYRDILYIEAKVQNGQGKIEDLMQSQGNMNPNFVGTESGQLLLGYTVDKEGFLSVPVFGRVKVEGKTVEEAKELFIHLSDSLFNHVFVDVKLLSFKFTVMGEVFNPGTYFNYNNYLTILEAIGRSGGLTDYGNRKGVLVIRPTEKGTKTFRVDLNDKNILNSEAYFIMPNDVLIVEPLNHKVFSLNLPLYTFIVSSVTGLLTTSLLLINYFGK